MLNPSDTIVAVASPAGPGIRGVVRMSGPQALDILSQVFSTSVELSSLVAAAIVTGTMELTDLGQIECEAFVWPDERSYTRQPSVELQLIGAAPILDTAVATLTSRGARIAEPGEFTLRAFLAGRLDLTQAEAVLGVIQARSDRQLESSLQQLAGGLTAPLQQCRNELLDLLAHLEAGLDFVEEDIEFISSEKLTNRLTQIQQTVLDIQQQLNSRSEHSELPRVVLQGAPNVGKSSLLNALVDEEAAIISSQAGTTRDYLTRDVRINDVACRLVDTAGVDETLRERGTADAAALEATARQTDDADLTLLCLDAAQRPSTWEQQQLAAANSTTLVVWTKCDLVDDPPQLGALTSSLTGQGLTDLKQAVARRLEEVAGEGVAATATRCRDSLQAAAQSLETALQTTTHNMGDELVAAELRVCLEHLGRVVGAVYTDDVLDRIFSRFCIGK